MESKRDIRKRILDVRASLSQHVRKEMNQAITEKVINHPFFLTADCIYCYVDYNSEVETRRIIETAWSLNKKVAVPKIEGDVMHFYYINDFSDLHEGYRGIMEPKTDCPANDNQALVIMPGVAFDNRLQRIGYGKGYYDKFLENHRGHTLAISYELQIVDYIPAQIHDFCPEVLITEDKIYE